MQTRPFLFEKLFFTTARFAIEKDEGKRRRRSFAIARYRYDSTRTTNLCNNLAPRRRVKCANIGSRHESVRKPVELQPPVIKSEERRCDVGLKLSSDVRWQARRENAGEGEKGTAKKGATLK